MIQIVCKNCNHTFEGNYCNFCGQSAATDRISKHFLIHDLQMGFLSFDKGVLFTIRELCIRPGSAIRDFLNGKRVRYFKPISFFLLFVGIYSFIFLFFNIDVTHLSAYRGTEDAQYKTAEWMTNNFGFVSLVILPMISLSSFLAFRKDGYTYTEHIVINSYLSGMATVFAIVLCPIFIIVPKESQWAMSNSIEIIISCSYRFWAYYQIFSHLIPCKRIVKLFIAFVYFLLIMALILIPITSIAMLLYDRLG